MGMGVSVGASVGVGDGRVVGRRVRVGVNVGSGVNKFPTVQALVPNAKTNNAQVTPILNKRTDMQDTPLQMIDEERL
jgi:hypothetical protein